MKRVAGFVELFTQKVPAVRAGHKKSTLTDSEQDENLYWTLDFLSFQNGIMYCHNLRYSENNNYLNPKNLLKEVILEDYQQCYILKY